MPLTMTEKKKKSCNAIVRNLIVMVSVAWTRNVSILLRKQNASIAGQDVRTNGVFMLLIAAATFLFDLSLYYPFLPVIF